MSIDCLFVVPASLPTVPKVVEQLIRSFDRDDVTVEEIASRLAADPVLSARTLRLANSAYFHVSRRIETVDEALRMLGFVMVRNLVIGLGVAGAFPRVPGVDLPQLWRYSAHTACAARWLAQAAGQNGELAFTVGLLHGIGHLLMHTALRDELAPLDRRCHLLAAGRAEAERAAFGYHHGEVGAALAVRWRFPDSIAAPLRAVPQPLDDDDAAPVAALVHLAAWRARVEALRPAAEAIGPGCPHAAARAIGLQMRWLDEAATLELAGLPPRRMPPLAELCAGLETLLGPA